MNHHDACTKAEAVSMSFKDSQVILCEIHYCFGLPQVIFVTVEMNLSGVIF